MPDFFKPLFNPNLLKSRAAHVAPAFTPEQMQVVENWARTAADPAFRDEKEKPFQGQFLTDVLGGLLGYVLPAGHLGAYNLKAESASSETKGGKTPDARLGFITSGTFANANFAAPSRAWLPTAARYCRLVNFGENQPFADAGMVFPTISILEKVPAPAPLPEQGPAPVDRPWPHGQWPRAAAAPLRPPGAGSGREAAAAPCPAPHTFRTYFMRGGIPDSIPDAVASAGLDCDDSVFGRSEWRFQPAAVSTLFDRIMATGQPLGKVVNGRIYRGVLTGLNEAFIIDRAPRDRLVTADPGCASIICKMLRGEDLRPWYCQDEGRLLIVMRCGFTRQGMGGPQAEAGVPPGRASAAGGPASGGEALTTSLAPPPTQDCPERASAAGGPASGGEALTTSLAPPPPTSPCSRTTPSTP